ncbi:MAG: tetratricopeptide repeat protein [Nitrospirota bacterium]
MKKFLLFFFLCLLLGFTQASGSDLYSEFLDRGIRNSETCSYSLIEQAKTRQSEAESILKQALKCSPDLPATYFELAKANFALTPENVFTSLNYTLQGIAAYQRNFWWAFMAVSSVFWSLVLSFILSILIVSAIKLPQDIPLLSHDLREDRTTLMLLSIFIFALFGPLYFLGSLLMLTSFYMKKSNKVAVILYLIFLLSSPWIFKAISLSLNAPTLAELKAVVQVNESKGSGYALSVLKDRDHPTELFSYALALKRDGRYLEAIKAYNNLISKRKDPRAYNNLANCYVAVGDFEKAKELYKKSIEIEPHVSSLYNLSQVYRETFDFDNGEKYFLAAQQADFAAVSSFRATHSRNPNRFVIDESLPLQAVWDYTRDKIGEYSTMGLSTVPHTVIPVIAVLMGVLFYILDRRFKNRAYRCHRCGKILCNKCEKHILWGHMCLQCYRSLVKLDELDSKERIARLLTVYDYRKKRKNIIKVLSLILPGSGQIYAGSTLYGLVFLWSFLFFLFVPLMNSIFDIGMYNSSHLWLTIISLFLAVVLYVACNILTRRRLAKGWL